MCLIWTDCVLGCSQILLFNSKASQLTPVLERLDGLSANVNTPLAPHCYSRDSKIIISYNIKEKFPTLLAVDSPEVDQTS